MSLVEMIRVCFKKTELVLGNGHTHTMIYKTPQSFVQIHLSFINNASCLFLSGALCVAEENQDKIIVETCPNTRAVISSLFSFE